MRVFFEVLLKKTANSYPKDRRQAKRAVLLWSVEAFQLKERKKGSQVLPNKRTTVSGLNFDPYLTKGILN